MEQDIDKGIFDLDVRHFIYADFADTARSPSAIEAAKHFKCSLFAVHTLKPENDGILLVL
ncbi:MAG TPA: hypothetical protein VMW34_07250 [Anaerolineales bacterium]|nr:hypothetical protein [Anaerolineales bacterium]